MKSNLANIMASSPNIYEIKHNAWHNERILVIGAEDLLKLNEKQYAVLAEIADKIYPKGAI
jgi:ABC-type hemin transport system substrate-binding protein